MKRFRLAVVGLSLLALAATGCSKDSSDTTAAAATETTAAAEASETTAAATETTPAAATETTAAATATEAVGAATAPVEEGTFQMGIEPWLGYGGWLVADKQGFFKDNGVDVSIASFTTDDEINAALVAGKLDGANIATHTALRLKSEGTPITILTVLDQSNEADAIIAKTGVTGIADLKGKKVAFEKGTTSDLLLNAALAEAGMTLADITPVAIPAADVATALGAGQVDAGVTYEPYITPFLQNSKDYSILYPASKIPGIISDVFVVRDAVLEEKPGQVFALLKSLGAAIDFYGTNTKDAQAIITEGVGSKAGELDLAFNGVKFYTTAEAKALLAGDFITKTVPRRAEGRHRCRNPHQERRSRHDDQPVVYRRPQLTRILVEVCR